MSTQSPNTTINNTQNAKGAIAGGIFLCLASIALYTDHPTHATLISVLGLIGAFEALAGALILYLNKTNQATLPD